MGRGNSFGKMLTITSFGESHGEAVGAVIDGVPEGLEVSVSTLQQWLDERAPGRSSFSSARAEPDQVEILSGVYLGKTLGTPILALVKNKDARSSDYLEKPPLDRAGHADRSWQMKFSHHDPRGSGRASGRETIGRVMGGYFASLVVPQVEVDLFAVQVGSLKGVFRGCESDLVEMLDQAKMSGESYGAKVQIRICGVPGGLGEPCFDKLKSELCRGLMSIGAIMGVEVGEGFNFAQMKGSEASKERNLFGGIEGGISNGDPIKMSVVVKPPSTVGERARSGRHDPCLIPRIFPVIKSMIYLVIADHLLRQNAYQIFIDKNVSGEASKSKKLSGVIITT